MNVLVTGGAGFIGSHITDQLLQSGYQPIVIDNLSNGYREAVSKGVPLYVADIGDSQFLENFFKIHKIEIVIHCAAFVNVEDSMNRPLEYYQNNLAYSINFLKACKFANVKSFIFSSSAAVYGQPDEIPIKETTPTLPVNPYGKTKLMFEKILIDSCALSSSKMNYVICRYFNVAGADVEGQRGQFTKEVFHLIQVACRVISGHRNHIKIYGVDYPTPDGTCIRDFIHVQDLAIAHVQMVDYLKNGGTSEIFNCGYGCGFSVREVLETMKKISGVDFKIVESKRRTGDPVQLVAGTEKIQKVLGWLPKYNDLSLICKTALEWECKLQNEVLKNNKR